MNKENKIIYVVESLGGGILSYLTLLCNELVEKGNHVTILYGVRKQTPEDLTKYFNEKVNLILIKNFQRSVSLSKDIAAYNEVKQHIVQINPDIVHLNSSKAGAIGRILKFLNFRKLKEVKFFYTPHGYSFLMGNENFLKIKIYYLIESVLGKLNTVTIACGIGEYGYARKIDKKSKFVNNCVDIDYIDSFNNKKDHTESSSFYTVGRISEQKNPMLFNSIALNHPNINFIWIGDGPMRSQLTSSNIDIKGWLPNSEVIKLIQQYNNFILTSKWEGLPIVLLEAMASYKECFVTNVSGNSEVINEDNGYLFNTVEDFDEIYNNFLKNKSVRKGKVAREYVENFYSKEKFIDGYLDIYSKR